MDLFPISDLQRFSGIKAHTIRIWEQRYQTLEPHRSEGNTRYYTGDQLRRLLNIVSLMSAGNKISELSVMSDKELWELLQQLPPQERHDNPAHEFFITQLIAAGMDFNEEYFEKLFSGCILRFGLKDTYIHIIYPLLVRVGFMWSKNSIPPAQEHFISNLLKQKLSVAIDSLAPAKEPQSPWILFLPEDEFHEISLLFSCFLVKQSGRKVIYLGASTSLDALKSTVAIVKPSHMLFFHVHYDDPKHTQAYFDQLSGTFSTIKLYVAGNEKLLSELKMKKNLEWIKSVHQLEGILK